MATKKSMSMKSAMKKVESSKQDKVMDKKAGYAEGSKADLAADKKMAKVLMMRKKGK